MADQPEAQKLLTHKPADYGGAEGADGADGGPDEKSSVFPFEPFCFLGPLQAFIPGTWRKIVSLPHLVLLIGIMACTAMLCNTLFSWNRFGCRTWSCQGRILPLVFVTFCLLYFLSTIQQYDEALQVKQKELQKAKQQCENQYKETVVEMEGFLNRAMDSQVVLAERNFESQRRDFSRFLMRYARDASEATDNALLPFRGLVLQWLLVFQECSIDPLRKPLKVLEAEELEQCNTVGDVASYTDERVKKAEVKFVTAQRENDKKELSLHRSVFKAIVTTQKADLKKRQTLCGTVPSFGEIDIEDGVTQTQVDDGPGEYRWVQWGRSKPFGARMDPESGSYPVELSLGCVTILLLSADHLRLIFGFLLAFPIMGFELHQGIAHSHRSVNWLILAQVFVCMVCIVFVLHQFLDMDIIAQLEGQLRELEAKRQHVEEKREKLVGFFDAVQRLADVWTHRTVTRLELQKHLQEKLRDAPQEEHASLMGVMNEKVDTLESSIPALEQWANGESLSSEKKKLFGSLMADLYQDRGDLQATLDIMDKASRKIRNALSDQPTAPEDALAEQAAAGELPQKSDGPAAEDPYSPGDQVEYLSASQGRWVPATVRRRNPLTGLYDLDCKDDVPPEKIRVATKSGWFRW
jgi:hypothetical protein